MVTTILFMYNILKRRADGHNTFLGSLMAMPLSSMSTANHSRLMIRLDCLYQRDRRQALPNSRLGPYSHRSLYNIGKDDPFFPKPGNDRHRSAHSDFHFFASTSTFSGEGFLKQMLAEGIRMSLHCHGP